MRPVARFLSGCAVFAVEATIQCLNYWQALALVQQSLPGVYAFVVGAPGTIVILLVGLGFIISGAVGVRKQRSAPTGGISATQRTSGPQSPANIAGRDINVHYGPEPADVPSLAPRRLPPVERIPELACRGVMEKICAFPSTEYDSYREEFEFVDLPCSTVAFRNYSNTGSGCARRVVAHLDYHFDNGDTVSVDEGWWCEDADDSRGLGLFIDEGQTKYLVVSVTGKDNECAAVGKKYQRSFDRFMPCDIQVLNNGRCRLKIELRAQNFSETYYLESQIGDGKAEWSKPFTRPPTGETTPT